MYLITAAQKLEAGLSTTGLAGCGLGIGIVFAVLLTFYSY
jgi:tetrahydromethanopterin S-methyltransferase F subunit